MIFKLLNRITIIANSLALQNHILISDGPKYTDSRHLANHEQRTYSQNGEDGVIQHLLSKLKIESGTFLEIGVEDGLENNTRLLLEKGWHGTWIEAGRSNIKKIYRNFQGEIKTGQLKVIHHAVTPGNINRLLELHDIKRVDVLSIDIDLDTHHVWRAIALPPPAVAVIEYNASHIPPSRVETLFVEGRCWDGKSAHYGASLQSIVDIGNAQGLLLVGCELSGVNAFFVRSDLVSQDLFLMPNDALFHYEPARHLISPPGVPRWS